MTDVDHYAEAEACLALIAEQPDASHETIAELIGLAQAHATLAIATRPLDGSVEITVNGDVDKSVHGAVAPMSTMSPQEYAEASRKWALRYGWAPPQ